MNTIIDNLFNLDILEKTNIVTNENNETSGTSENKSIKNSLEYTKHKYDSETPNPSLYQGYKFKNYQDKITTITEDASNKEKNSLFEEGFVTGGDYKSFGYNLAQQSEALLKKVDNTLSTSQKATFENLKKEYNTTLTQYSDLVSKISQNYTDHSSRNNSNNPYLNKFIRFTTGHVCYVTNKGIVKWVPDPTILNSISGKNGCPSYSSSSQVNLNMPWSTNYNIPGTEIPTTPKLISGTPMRMNESCGNEGKNVFVNSMLSKPSATYVGCYQDSASNPAMTFIGGAPNVNGSAGGKYTYEQCQLAAVMGGYNFFALQNVNSTNGLGYCAVSNNQTTSTQYGTSYVPVPLWSSNTSGKPATYAILTNAGTLSVRDGNGNVYYTTPNSSVNCAQITYSMSDNVDAPGNDLGFFSNQNVNSCKTLCNERALCSGFAFNKSNNNSCWIKTGGLNNTGKNKARTMYKKTVNTSQCVFFLSLQSDGNMCIYKGTPNARNNTYVWCSFTNGKQQVANGNYTPSKGKYGQPFITTNQVLNKGDWLSSVDGKLLLIMQNDGNLVLYTFKINCTNSLTNNPSNSKTYGGVNANAIYNIGKTGIKTNLGQVAYVDPDSQLYPYPSSNITYDNTYSTVIQNSAIQGSDIQGAATTNIKNVNDCMNVCNKDKNCNSFVFDTSTPSPICLPKNITDVSSANIVNPSNSKTTFIRDKKPINVPVGVTSNTNKIDTIQYENYAKGQGKMQSSYGFSDMINSVQKQQLSQLQDKLTQLSTQITYYSSRLNNDNDNVNEQMKKDLKGFSDYIKQTDVTNAKIKRFNVDNNFDNILNETNIKILQQNYSYMAWSILAVVVVIVAINIKK